MEDLFRMAGQFHQQSCYHGSLPLDLASFGDTIARLCTAETGCVLVAERDGKPCGMAAATIARSWMNADVLVGQELFWWVDPDARGTGAGTGLIDGLEGWAREAGCSVFYMASTGNLRPDALARYYRRRGYVPHDIYYARAF